VSFPGRGTDATGEADNAIHDDKYYYMWSPENKLYRGEIGGVDASSNTWIEKDGNNSANYKSVTFVLIDGKVHIRSGHLPEEPFVELDSDKCAVKESYTPFTSEGNLLNWTKDGENSTDGDDNRGYRYLRATQMHYKNNELWVMAVYK